jgi:hypothetical protein
MYLLPLTNLEKLTKIIRKFFWGGNSEKRKYHLVKWDLVCKPRQKGGLGIKNLQLFNQCLLCKWWWKLETEEGLWQSLVKAKYDISKSLHHIKLRNDDSPVWKDLWKVKHLYLNQRMMVVGDGKSTDFWNDAWCGSYPFCEKFPELFAICLDQQLTVAEAAVLGWQFRYRRWMSPEIQSQWRCMRDKLAMIALNRDQDKPRWKLTKSGIFSVKSLYNKLSAVGVDRSFKQLWKAKIPLKIKIWLWLIWHNAIATKDNMKKRKWIGSFTCQFCPADETITHLFFTCPMAAYMWSTISTVLGVFTRPSCFTQYFWWIAKVFPVGPNFHIVGIAALCWAIWKTRNNACFEGKLISSPMGLICYMCAFLRYWAGLQGENDREMLMEGASRLQRGAMAAHEMARQVGASRARIQEGVDEDEEVSV